MSCNFMPYILVRHFHVLHFHVLHFQRPQLCHWFSNHCPNQRPSTVFTEQFISSSRLYSTQWRSNSCHEMLDRAVNPKCQRSNCLLWFAVVRCRLLRGNCIGGNQLNCPLTGWTHLEVSWCWCIRWCFRHLSLLSTSSTSDVTAGTIRHSFILSFHA